MLPETLRWNADISDFAVRSRFACNRSQEDRCNRIDATGNKPEQMEMTRQAVVELSGAENRDQASAL